MKIIIIAMLMLPISGCLSLEHFYQTPNYSTISKRPGTTDQYVIKDANGNRTGIISKRPGSTDQYVIKDVDGNRTGIISKRPGSKDQYVIKNATGTRTGTISNKPGLIVKDAKSPLNDLHIIPKKEY